MTITALGVVAAPAHSTSARRAKLVQTGAAAGLALLAAMTTHVLLPHHAYVASAMVGIEGGQGALRPALAQAAADAALSRQVLARAATLSGSASLDNLAQAVRAEVGHVPGSLVVRAQDAAAEHAAGMATSVATALVAELEARAQDADRAVDTAAALRLAKLQESAAAAHQRLAGLGGDAVDPAASGVGIAARIAALRTRLDALHAIMAAGTPPLGAGRDVPANIEALQTSYLDLTRQLAKASETLGDRHTTVIGLRDGIKRTAAELTGAWTRLAKQTEADLAEAKSRAIAVAKNGSRDAGRAAMVEAARAAALAADDAVARAQGAAHDEDVAHYRLIARAPVPAVAEGLAPPVHLAAAALAGLVMLLLSRAVLRPRAPALVEEPSAHGWEPNAFPLPEPVATPEPALDMATPDRSEAVSSPAVVPIRAREAAARSARAPREDILRATLHARTAASLREPLVAPRRAATGDLVAATERALPALAALVPRNEIPVIMVATNDTGANTMDVVLALGEAAAAEGQRVLIVEGRQARPALAASVAEGAEPALVEVFGDWRVVLRAEIGDGLLYLAPSFRDGARLAEDLAGAHGTLVADALADEFDLVVIDGDRAAEAEELAGEADAFLRVGRFASAHDDERFLALLGAPHRSLLGTIAAEIAVFIPASQATSKPEAASTASSLPGALQMSATARSEPRPSFAAPRRTNGSDLRRRANLR